MISDVNFINPEEVVATASQMHAKSGGRVLVLIGGEVCDAASGIVLGLQEADIPFFGGVFPDIMLGNRTRKDMCVVVCLPTLGTPHILQAPFSSEGVDELPGYAELVEASGREDISALVFISGLTLDLTGFTRNLYRKYGVNIQYLGGGTGTVDLDPDLPSLFSSEGLFSNAAMIVFLDAKVGVGVQHGWNRRLGPFIATLTEGRTIHEINWRPAHEVFAEAALELTGEVLTDENFRKLASLHPFGLSKDGDEDLIREAHILQGTSIICTGDILPQSAFFIMESKPESLRQAAVEASEQAHVEQASFGLVFECLTRFIYLGSEPFGRELESIESAGGVHVPCVGVTALGEFAANKRGILEVLNKTVVVAKIESAL